MTKKHKKGGSKYPRKSRYIRKMKGANQRHQPSLVSSRLKQLGGYLKRNSTAVRAVLIFGGCILLFMFVYTRLLQGEVLEPYCAFTARATGFFVGLLGINLQVVGTMISSVDFSMGIVDVCTGIVPMVILISAVVAYPCTIKQKAEGIALGVLLLFVLNLFRMVTLFLIGTYIPGIFDTAHYIVWQSLMILLAIGIWLFWMEKLVHVPAR